MVSTSPDKGNSAFSRSAEHRRRSREGMRALDVAAEPIVRTRRVFDERQRRRRKRVDDARYDENHTVGIGLLMKVRAEEHPKDWNFAENRNPRDLVALGARADAGEHDRLPELQVNDRLELRGVSARKVRVRAGRGQVADVRAD